MSQEALAKHFEIQAQACAGLGSPFAGRLLGLIGADLGADSPYVPMLESWAGEDEQPALMREAVALRLLGGLNDLVLSGSAPELAALFPAQSSNSDDALLAAAARRAAAAHAGRLADFVRWPPQTNEIGRSFVLLGGMLEIVQASGLPLRCFELGASAGLNLNWDRYGYDFGGQGRWGDADAPLRLTGELRGGRPPLETHVRVVERAACDQNPINVADPDQARRLEAYIWPDQSARLARVRAAIELARNLGTMVERADASEWTVRNVRPQDGAATVLYHSVFWQYPTEAVREALEAAIEAAGAQASESAPFAWLRMEPTPAFDYELRLTMWPGGRERLLATSHPHGAWLDWRDGARI